MKFRAEHVIRNISVADYESLYFDEAFSEALCQSVKLCRKLISREVLGTALHRAVMVGPDREIPGPVAKILGASRIEYTEHIDYTFGTFAGRWHTVSSVLTDKVQSLGTFLFVPQGPDVVRVVEGDVTVKIFGLGSIVERFIAADVEKSYAEAAAFTNSYLAAHSRSGARHHGAS